MKRTGLALLGLCNCTGFLPAPFSVHAAGHECNTASGEGNCFDPLSGEAWNWVLWDEEAVWISCTQETASDGSKMRREVVWTSDLGLLCGRLFPSDEAPAADAESVACCPDGTLGRNIRQSS